MDGKLFTQQFPELFCHGVDEVWKWACHLRCHVSITAIRLELINDHWCRLYLFFFCFLHSVITVTVFICSLLQTFWLYFLFPFCLDIIFSLGLAEWWIVRLKCTRTLFLYKHGFIFYFSADWKEQKFGNMDLLFQSFLFLLLSGSGSGRNLLWGRKKSRNCWLMNITHNHWNRIVLFFKK